MTRGGGSNGWLVLLAVAAIAAGCGAPEEPPSTTTARMGARAQTQPDESAERAAAAVVEVDEDSGSAFEVRGNRAPRMTGLQVDPAPRVPGGHDVRAVAYAADPDGDELELIYSWWVNDDEVDEDGPALSTSGLRRGDRIRLDVTASDGQLTSAPMSAAAIEVTSRELRIVSTPAAPGADGVFRYQVEVEDPDGDLRFRLEQAPEGMTIEPLGGLVEWRLTNSQASVQPVRISVEDAHGATAEQSFELTVGASRPAAPAD